MRCSKCNLDFINNGSLTKHENSCRLSKIIIENLILDYKNGLSILKLSKKYNCSKFIVSKIIFDIKRTRAESNKIAHKLYPESFKHTDDSKKKMRDARLKFMKENPEKTAWRQSNLSYPEKLFLNKITELKLNEKYLIIREKSVFPYFIDFAFENQKLAIEIDGSQHNNIDRKESDIKKDILLNSIGWIVLRFTANKIKFELDDCIDTIITFLKKEDTQVGVYEYKEFKKKIKLCKCGKEILHFSKNCIKCSGNLSSFTQRKVDRPPYDQLLNEVNELGYSATGRKYGVSDNSIRKWIKFYENSLEN